MAQIRSLFAVLIFISCGLWAQTSVLQGGEINGNQTWSGIIRITGDIIIPASARLTINPGTQILFDPVSDNIKSGSDKTRCEIIVRGSLMARGAANNKIVFSSAAAQSRMSDWYGIQFLHSKSENIIDYCIIEYAYNGVTVKNTNMNISNSEIRYNYNAGVRVEVKAAPQITGNIVSENGYAGFICELGAKPILTENLVTGNPMGIVILSLSQPNLGEVGRGDNYNPGKNQFLNNEEYDIYNHSNKPVSAQNNTWDSSVQTAIAAKIYDQNDNSKYGRIDFTPVYNSRSQQSSLNSFIALAQDSDVPGAAQSNLEGNQLSSNQTSINGQQPVPDVERNDIISRIDSTMAQRLDEQNPANTAPLIASATAPPPDEVGESTQIEQIDYERIFLEPFLDRGKKKVINKEPVAITSILKTMMSPGTIRVKVVVDQHGRVETASILRGINDYMDEAVLAAVSKFIYDVGTVNGIPVRFSTNEVFRFK